MNQNQSLLDTEPTRTALAADIEAGYTNSTLAKKYSTSEKSIRRFRKRHGLNPKAFEPGGFAVEGDEGEVDTGTVKVLQDPDTMIRQRGLDPDEWMIADGMRVNQYEGPAPADSDESKITYYQTRFNIVRKDSISQIMAPRTDGWIAPPKREPNYDEPRLVVICGDQQAPWVDWNLHYCFTQWLEDNQPDEGVGLGDSFDFPDIRPGQRVHPRHTAHVNECLQVGYDVWRGYVEASTHTRWKKLIGNHDERITNILLDTKARGLADLQRPTDENGGGEYLHSLSHAARLDELGIEVVEAGGPYAVDQIKLSKHLAVRHGWIARKGSGSSALGSLEALRYSIVVGHTHRLGIVFDTKASIDGEVNTIQAAESGCMCRVSQVPDDKGRVWPGYTVAPDWQQGFLTATIWPDGKFHLEPAVFVNNTLLWRDQRYTV